VDVGRQEGLCGDGEQGGEKEEADNVGKNQPPQIAREHVAKRSTRNIQVCRGKPFKVLISLNNFDI